MFEDSKYLFLTKMRRQWHSLRLEQSDKGLFCWIKSGWKFLLSVFLEKAFEI